MSCLKLLLPGVDLIGMHLVTLGQIGHRRLLPTDGCVCSKNLTGCSNAARQAAIDAENAAQAQRDAAIVGCKQRRAKQVDP